MYRVRNGIVRLLVSVAMGVAIFASSLGEVPSILAGTDTITEYPLPSPNAGPSGIVATTDGTLWFTEENASKIGKRTPLGAVREFPLPPYSAPIGITAGPDGDGWFTNGDEIGKITPLGDVSAYPLPGGSTFSEAITTGPDGNLWATVSRLASRGQMSLIDRITPAGAITEFPIPTTNGLANGIAPGPDGDLWFAGQNGGKIGKITPAGTVTEYPIPNGLGIPTGITGGPGGTLWFTETKYASGSATGVGMIGRITTAGVITEFPTPTVNSVHTGITAGMDGNLWFTEVGGNSIGRITPAGAIAEFPLPTAHGLACCGPQNITAGPDGSIWFTEFFGNQIGKISVTIPIAACSQTGGSLQQRTTLHCTFTSPGPDARLVLWSAPGFTPVTSHQPDQTFAATWPRPASITAIWLDRDGAHQREFRYSIARS